MRSFFPPRLEKVSTRPPAEGAAESDGFLGVCFWLLGHQSLVAKNGLLVASLRLSGTNRRYFLCALTARPPRLLLLARLMHHATIKALQPAPHEPKHLGRGARPKSRYTNPADAEGPVHFSSWLLAVCSDATVTKMSEGVRRDTDRTLAGRTWSAQNVFLELICSIKMENHASTSKNLLSY